MWCVLDWGGHTLPSSSHANSSMLNRPGTQGTVYSVMSLLNALRLAMGKKFTR